MHAAIMPNRRSRDNGQGKPLTLFPPIVRLDKILGTRRDTPRAKQTIGTYTAWEPERFQRIREGWNDRYFRLFGELL